MLAAGLLLAACGSSNANEADTNGKIKVVAAENFWGSIASQLGGDRVEAVNVITSPDADPHDYEPSARDGATFAQAQLVIVNGLGYDAWATKAIEASPATGREVVTVGSVVGLKAGDNPHRWYSPSDVDRVISAVTDKLKIIKPDSAAYFDAQRADFITNKLAKYNELRTAISTKYAGTPVAATESIAVPLATDLKLDLITPVGLLNAVSEGDEPTAADKIVASGQLVAKDAKVLVVNKQNSTPDVQLMVFAARQQHIPVVEVTETLEPFSATFQDWQSAQLQSLADALATATGK